MNPLITAFPRRFSCDCAATVSATPNRRQRDGINEDTAETSVLRGLARLNRLSLIWLTRPPYDYTARDPSSGVTAAAPPRPSIPAETDQDSPDLQPHPDGDTSLESPPMSTGSVNSNGSAMAWQQNPCTKPIWDSSEGASQVEAFIANRPCSPPNLPLT